MIPTGQRAFYRLRMMLTGRAPRRDDGEMSPEQMEIALAQMDKLLNDPVLADAEAAAAP